MKTEATRNNGFTGLLRSNDEPASRHSEFPSFFKDKKQENTVIVFFGKHALYISNLKKT